MEYIEKIEILEDGSINIKNTKNSTRIPSPSHYTENCEDNYDNNINDNIDSDDKNYQAVLKFKFQNKIN